MSNLFENEAVDVTDDELEDISFIDILNMPVEIAFSELAKKGADAVKSAKQTARDTFKSVQDEEYRKMCKPVLTMDECVSWMKVQCGNYPQAGYFFIYEEENPKPRNENDVLSVALALLDKNKKPICVNGERSTKLFPVKSKEIVCVVIPAKTIDVKLVKALNGTQSVLIKL